jgi:hypothetical protein
MNKFEEFTKKLAADENMQKEFLEAEKNEKLDDFLKKYAPDITADELKAYAKKAYAEAKANGEIPEEELDKAAGGQASNFSLFHSLSTMSALMRSAFNQTYYGLACSSGLLS